jgi:DNA-directed RNA polymerase specialized sigma24 family protein
MLTHGDASLSQEIVQELCLYFTISKPDLSQVENVEGYLYTSLRHIYLSAMARSVREAERSLRGVDFDSLQIALDQGHSDGLVQRQNDLRRICTYTMWRKESSKGACYLALLFFHGYTRSQVSEIARVPIPSIYNKVLKTRGEIKAHLEHSTKVRIVRGELPPEPTLHFSAVSSSELFGELRETVKASRRSPCFTAESLLAYYEPKQLDPIPTSVLAHIVSCELCLSQLDGHFGWPDHNERDADGVFSSFDAGADTEATPMQPISYHEMMRRVQRDAARIYEYRPRILSIAVNGRIVASHEIQSECNSLSSRLEQHSSAKFIEVFADQRIRLALIQVEKQPPTGQSSLCHTLELSDGRRLKLAVRFDGLGLYSEIDYSDPGFVTEALSRDVSVDETRSGAGLSSASLSDTDTVSVTWATRVRSTIWPLFTTSRIAWTCVFIALLTLDSFITYRGHLAHPSATEILAQSIRVEGSGQPEMADHVISQFEQDDETGKPMFKGSMDELEDPSRQRYIRRLYDDQHHLVAAQWRGEEGKVGSYLSDAIRQEASAIETSLGVNASAGGFQKLTNNSVSVLASDNGYELTYTSGVGDARVRTAVLVIDRNFHFVSEKLKLVIGNSVNTIRFVRISVDRQPSTSLPDDLFRLDDLKPEEQSRSSSRNTLKALAILPNPHLFEIEIAVLKCLNELNADSAEPIDVSLSSEGRIRVTGVLAPRARRDEIVAALDSLPDRQLIETQLSVQQDLHRKMSGTRWLRSIKPRLYEVNQPGAPADSIVHGYFARSGLSDKKLTSASIEYSRSVLDHTQRAVQHAFALQRLGDLLNKVNVNSLGSEARQKWVHMAARHASMLESELLSLDDQITVIIPEGTKLPGNADPAPIENPADFARAADRVLVQTQALSESVGMAFASNAATKTNTDPESIIVSVERAIPLGTAREIASFSFRLENSQQSVTTPSGSKK